MRFCVRGGTSIGAEGPESVACELLLDMVCSLRVNVVEGVDEERWER
jgi:hypothetical protein